MSRLSSPLRASSGKGFTTRKRLLLILCMLVLSDVSVRAQALQNDANELPTASPRTGKITGRVVAEDGRPLSEVVVFFYRSHSPASGPAQSATTDGDGQFQISNLTPGLYAVSASLAGFVSTQDPATEVGEPKYYRLGDSVSLTLVKGGVITGTVRQANGEPVVAVPIRAMRVRDANGRSLARVGTFPQTRVTDDRGIYRLYGLPLGTYLVTAGGNMGFSGMYNAYEGDAPTYFPSSTRDTAAEVTVRSGEEATGIDIRYRSDRGHVVSGTVAGPAAVSGRDGTNVTLAQASSGAIESTSYIQPGSKAGFSFNSVADGEYELIAQQGIGTQGSVSAPRKITVKGSDVTGIELPLVSLGSISGSVFLEAAPKDTCNDKRGGTFLETLIAARRDERTASKQAARMPFFYGNGSVPNDQGKFTIHNLQAGSYRLTVRVPNDMWYVRSVAVPGPPSVGGASAQSKPAEIKAAAARPILTLKTSEKVSDVTINIAQDAATLRGRVQSGDESAGLPANLRVYLVPTERERHEDTFRYSEATLGNDGTFAIPNIAPGQYFIIARVAPEDDPGERYPSPLTWNPDARAKLRRDAEAGNTAVEFKPCQRVDDYSLRFGMAPAVTKP